MSTIAVRIHRGAVKEPPISKPIKVEAINQIIKTESTCLEMNAMKALLFSAYSSASSSMRFTQARALFPLVLRAQLAMDFS